MEPADKNKQGFSMEGRGLSVSECPEAWRAIARLGNAAPWVLTKPNNKFLHVLGLSTADRVAMYAWGEAQGLIRSCTLYHVQWFDEDQQDTVAFSFESKEAALHELGTDEEAEEEGKSLIELSGYAATPALTELSGYLNGELPLALVPHMLAVAYADYLGLDGVFWNERLDVGALSAPRAVISLSKLSSWTVLPPESTAKKQ